MRIIENVEVKETYPGSCHYTIDIVLKGTGGQKITFARQIEGKEAEIGEGYGVFRKEYALGLAKLLLAEPLVEAAESKSL